MDVDVSLCVCRRGGNAPDSVHGCGVMKDHWLCRHLVNFGCKSWGAS
jgi:hypothetical protein